MNFLKKNELDFHKHVGDLFIEQLRQGNSIRMIFKGSSMQPFLKRGDTVTVKPIQLSEARIGDIIAFRRERLDKTLTLHRLIKKKQEVIVTKGDANRFGDPLIHSENICGKVIKIERGGKTKNLETTFHRLFSYLIVYTLWGYAAAKDVLSYPIRFIKTRLLKK